ncbi:unnamed protein product [Mytilus edulis]|uniref:Transposase n=1 Tax=Mytilus edulis TaxID=6550 RepID=A0A8S3Q139_MYTED|nr:unnamed protein product [Mytilus edulis]
MKLFGTPTQLLRRKRDWDRKRLNKVLSLFDKMTKFANANEEDASYFVMFKKGQEVHFVDLKNRKQILNPIEMVWSQLKRHLSTINMTSKEELVNNIRLFWITYMTKLQCATYIDHVVPVCILMKEQATCGIPNKIFKEPSHGKTISYFQNLLWSLGYDDVRKRLGL